jgi:hypothetical protein
MLNLVLTTKMAEKGRRPAGWSTFWRAVLTDQKSEGGEIKDEFKTLPHGRWDLLPCTMPSKATTGPWVYFPRKGRLVIFFAQGLTGTGEALRLFGVHWNFQVIYSSRQCTGKGDAPQRPAGDQDMIWVMGPGVPVRKPKPPVEMVIIPEITITARAACDPLEAWPLVCPDI